MGKGLIALIERAHKWSKEITSRKMGRGWEQAICKRLNTGHSKHMSKVVPSSQRMHIKSSGCTLGVCLKGWEYIGDEEWNTGTLLVDCDTIHIFQREDLTIHTNIFDVHTLLLNSLLLNSTLREQSASAWNRTCKRAAELIGYKGHIRGQRPIFSCVTLEKLLNISKQQSPHL